jgi:hypothetical protein
MTPDGLAGGLGTGLGADLAGAFGDDFGDSGGGDWLDGRVPAGASPDVAGGGLRGTEEPGGTGP